MGEGELRLVKFEKKVERCSRPSPPPRNGVKAELSRFKVNAPPEVIIDKKDKLNFEILVRNQKGEERLLNVRKFFSKREQTFIFRFTESEERENVARRLFEIKRIMGNGKITDALMDSLEKIFKLHFGQFVAIEFLRNIEHQSKVEWKRNALINVVPAFGSEPIIGSFEIFADIGIKTVTNSAGQLVEMGFRLKDRSAVEKLGVVIVTLNGKFGYLATQGYRANLMRIATNEKISNESRALLVHAISNCLLNARTEEQVDILNKKVSTYIRETDDPEMGIVTLCGLPQEYNTVISFLKDRAGKEPEAATEEFLRTLADEFNIKNIDGHVKFILSFDKGLLNKASEAIGFAVAAGGKEHGDEMVSVVIDKLMELNNSILISRFLSEFTAFARTHFDMDILKKECINPKWNETGIFEIKEN